MRKRDMIAVCMSIAAFWSIACNENNPIDSTNDNETVDIDDRVSSEIPNSNEWDDIVAEGEDVPVSINWKKSTDSTSGYTDGINLSLRNNTGVRLDVSVKLNFFGMVEMAASVDMEPVQLPAFQTKNVYLSAADIPIQSSIGASNATAEVTVLDSEGNASTSLLSSEIFYRHAPDFSGVMTFDITYLVNELDGQLTPIPSAIQSKGGMSLRASTPLLGKVMDSAGKFVDITKDNEAFMHIEDGRVIGMKLGETITTNLED